MLLGPELTLLAIASFVADCDEVAICETGSVGVAAWGGGGGGLGRYALVFKFSKSSETNSFVSERTTSQKERNYLLNDSSDNLRSWNIERYALSWRNTSSWSVHVSLRELSGLSFLMSATIYFAKAAGSASHLQ